MCNNVVLEGSAKELKFLCVKTDSHSKLQVRLKMREIHKNRISKAGEFSVACEDLGPELHSFAVDFLENVWQLFMSYYLTFFSLLVCCVLARTRGKLMRPADLVSA